MSVIWRQVLGAAFGLFFLLGGTAQGVPMDQNDPYLWLEEVHGAKALDWAKEQNQKAFDQLKADPRFTTYESTIRAVLDAQDRIPYGSLRGDQVFNFWQDAQNPKGLWRRTSQAAYQAAQPQWEILLDLDALSKADGRNWVFKGATCRPDLQRCLISLSPGGGDAVVIREYDLMQRAFVAGGFELAEAKSSVAWLDKDRLLVASDFGPGTMTDSGYPRTVKLWPRNTALADARTIFEGQGSDVTVQVESFDTPQGLVGLIANAPSFFETDYYTLLPDGSALKIPLPRSADVKGLIKGQLIATLRKDWSQQETGPHFHKGALISFPLSTYMRTRMFPLARLIYAPDERSAIEQGAVGRDAIYAAITHNVLGAIHMFQPNGQGFTETKLDLPQGGSVGIVSANEYGPEAQFSFQSYLIPPTLFHSRGDGQLAAIKSLPARFDASSLVSEQFEAISKDGEKIPYSVVRPRHLKGPAPTLLYGYGGFEISLTPSYSANFGKLWLAHGGIYVVANIRGGGEFGPAWHDAALTTNRQKAFDDFAAVAEDLQKRGLTTAKQLGIMGGSNGGLLVSTVMTQRPDLFGAVVCQVPLIDMIRYTQIGAGPSWAAEYGDPADPLMRDYILSYSPYQNVRGDKTYPPILFVTATSDDRVTPVHARKMAARMMEQGHDVLFFENTDGGHSAAADHRQAAEMWALSFVYLAQRLGLQTGAQ